LIDGIPFGMSPTSDINHQRIATNVGAEFGIQLKKYKSWNVYLPVDYKVSESCILQPDVLIVYNEIEKDFLDFPPSLVAEILSPSTALKDKHCKFQIYEEQQVKYYLIISPDKEEVEVYAIEDGTYQLKQTGREFIYTFSFDDNCTATIDFKERSGKNKNH